MTRIVGRKQVPQGKVNRGWEKDGGGRECYVMSSGHIREEL